MIEDLGRKSLKSWVVASELEREGGKQSQEEVPPEISM